MNTTSTPKVAGRKPRQSKAPQETSGGSQRSKPASKTAPGKEKISASGSGQSASPVPQSRQITQAKKASVLRSPVLKLPVGKVAAPSSLEKKSSLVSANRAASTVKDEKKVDI